jgi:hypothetical protein
MNTVSHNLIDSARQTEASRIEHDRPPIPCDNQASQMSSAEQGREGREPGNPRSSRAFRSDCADLVHELANTTTAVLMNAQVLGWKLPPYSRLKRPLREIERNAQRGCELMKRLLSRLAIDTTRPACEPGTCGMPSSMESTNTVTAQEPGVDSGSAVNLPPRMSSHPAPVFSPGREVNSHQDVMPVLARFPKRDDGNEY